MHCASGGFEPTSPLSRWWRAAKSTTTPRTGCSVDSESITAIMSQSAQEGGFRNKKIVDSGPDRVGLT